MLPKNSFCHRYKLLHKLLFLTFGPGSPSLPGPPTGPCDPLDPGVPCLPPGPPWPRSPYVHESERIQQYLMSLIQFTIVALLFQRM